VCNRVVIPRTWELGGSHRSSAAGNAPGVHAPRPWGDLAGRSHGGSSAQQARQKSLRPQRPDTKGCWGPSSPAAS